MPDATVVKCSNCGWHDVITQIVPPAKSTMAGAYCNDNDYFTCKLPDCGKYQPVRVV